MAATATTLDVIAAPTARPHSPTLAAWRRLWRSPVARAGLVIVVVFLLVAVVTPAVHLYDAKTDSNLVNRLKPPTAAHPFGTDSLGRDVLVRVLHGTRVSLGLGVSAVAVASVLGSLVGLIAGYAGRRVDLVLMFSMDILLAFPSTLLAIAIVAMIGPGLRNSLLAISLVATLLLLRALERGSRAAWAAYGIAFTALVVWHPVAGVLLVPAHVVLLAQRREHVLPHGLLAAVIICAVAVPWAAVTAIRSTGEGVAMNWLTAPTPEVVVRTLLDVSGVAGLGIVLAFVGLWVLRRSGRSDSAVWLGAWAFTPFLLALLVSTVRPIYLDRYLIVAAPAFALLAGVAVTGVGSRLRLGIVLAAVVAASAGLIVWYSSGESGNWRGEDWRAAVRTVLERRNEGDAIVVAPWSAAPAATYYGAEVTDVSRADSIWVLTWSETGDDITAAERRALGFGDHELVEKLPFGWRLSAQLWQRQG